MTEPRTIKGETAGADPGMRPDREGAAQGCALYKVPQTADGHAKNIALGHVLSKEREWRVGDAVGKV